jgi:hypothetical protein
MHGCALSAWAWLPCLLTELSVRRCTTWLCSTRTGRHTHMLCERADLDACDVCDVAIVPAAVFSTWLQSRALLLEPTVVAHKTSPLLRRHLKETHGQGAPSHALLERSVTLWELVVLGRPGFAKDFARRLALGGWLDTAGSSW